MRVACWREKTSWHSWSLRRACFACGGVYVADTSVLANQSKRRPDCVEPSSQPWRGWSPPWHRLRRAAKYTRRGRSRTPNVWTQTKQQCSWWIFYRWAVTEINRKQSFFILITNEIKLHYHDSHSKATIARTQLWSATLADSKMRDNFFLWAFPDLKVLILWTTGF